MLSLVLTLSLGQTVWPPPGTPPFLFPAPLEPIRIEGAPALVQVGADFVSVWLDRRRGLDQPDAGLDVWAGSVRLGAPAFSSVLLTSQPKSCHSVRLAGGPSALTAAWACLTADGGAVERVQLTPTMTAHFPVLSSTPDFEPSLDLRLTAAPPRVVVTTRHVNSITIMQSTTPGTSYNLFNNSTTQSLVSTEDGGVALLTADPTTAVTAYDVLPDGGAPSSTPVGADAIRVFGVPGKSASTYFFESASKELRRRLVDGGVFPVGTNLSTAEPVVASVPQGGLVVFLSDGGLTANIAADSRTVTGASVRDGGTPLAIAGVSPDFMIAETNGREVQLRWVAVNGSLVSFGGPLPVFRAPRPQLALAGAWSPDDIGFAVLWDQRDGGAWETRGAIVDNGGVNSLGVISSSALPSRPSVALAADGGVYVALTDDLGRSLFELVGGTFTRRLPGTVLDEVVVGASSHLSWSPATGELRHSNGGSLMTTPVPPGCVSWWQGAYYLASNGGLMQILENGTTMMGQSLPPPPGAPHQRCATIGQAGRKLLATFTSGFVTVHDIDRAALIGTSGLLFSGTPAVVPVHDGVVVVAAIIPDGRRGTVEWRHFSGLVTTGGQLNADTQPVRNVRAAAAPNGDVLASWETFELDAGAWRVESRIIRDIPPPPDAGMPDAGMPDAGMPEAGMPDAGMPDAGSFDAGSFDAGSFDAGSFDAGSVDAGSFDASVDAGGPDAGVDDGGSPPDSGTPDAGSMGDAGQLDAGGTIDGGPELVTFVPVCGCSSSASGAGLFFALLLVLRSLKGRR